MGNSNRNSRVPYSGTKNSLNRNLGGYTGGVSGVAGGVSSGGSKVNQKKDKSKQESLDDAITKAKSKYGSHSKHEETQSLNKLVSNVGQATLEGIVLGAVCATVPGAAAIAIPLYKLYQVGKAANEVYKAYNETNGDEETKSDAALKEGAKQGVKFVVGEVVGKMTEGAAEKTANSIVQTTQSSGTLETIANTTHVNPDVFSEFLRGSIKGGLTEGTSELVSYVVVGD